MALTLWVSASSRLPKWKDARANMACKRLVADASVDVNAIGMITSRKPFVPSSIVVSIRATTESSVEDCINVYPLWCLLNASRS